MRDVPVIRNRLVRADASGLGPRVCLVRKDIVCMVEFWSQIYHLFMILGLNEIILTVDLQGLCSSSIRRPLSDSPSVFSYIWERGRGNHLDWRDS